MPPYYFFSHKNHRPKLGWWFCVVGVLVSRLSKEERKRRRRRRTRNLGECRNERVFDGDCKKPTIFRKSEKREREKTSAVLKIRSKSSALFISFRLGAEKTSEHDTCEFCTQSALLFTTKVPSPFTYSEKHLKEEGSKDFL